MFVAEFMCNYGCFRILPQKDAAEAKRVEYEELLDYYPVSGFVIDCVEYLVLKHYVWSV